MAIRSRLARIDSFVRLPVLTADRGGVARALLDDVACRDFDPVLRREEEGGAARVDDDCDGGGLDNALASRRSISSSFLSRSISSASSF